MSLNARVYDGWKAFVRENRPKVGNACVIELIVRAALVKSHSRLACALLETQSDALNKT